MKRKVKKFGGGGLSGDLGSLALIGGLGYMFGRGSKSLSEKEKAAKLAEAAKPAEAPKPDEKKAEEKAEPVATQADVRRVDNEIDATNKPAPVVTPKRKSSTAVSTDTTTKKSTYVDNENRPSKPYPKKQAEAYPKTKHNNKAPSPSEIDKLYKDQGITFTPDNPLVKKAEEKRAGKKDSATPVADKKVDAKPEKAPKVKSSSGFGPSNTFLTEERLDDSKKAMKGGWSKGLFEKGDLRSREQRIRDEQSRYKKGGKVKSYAKGGAVKSSASKRADGCAQRGKTRGKVL